MPLSEYEQRVLEQLENDLGSDPSLERAMARTPRSPARLGIAIAGVAVGLAVAVIAVAIQLPLLGIAGFALMAGVLLWAMLSPQAPSAKAATASTSKKPSPPTAKGKKPFMRRMEERFEQRREEGGL
jgi:hypothetical protein